MIRAARFCIRLTISSSILLYDVHTAYIREWFYDCVKANYSLIFLQVWAGIALKAESLGELVAEFIDVYFVCRVLVEA